MHFYLVSPSVYGHANSPTMQAKAGMHITKRPTYQKQYLAKVGSYQLRKPGTGLQLAGKRLVQ